MMTGSLTVNGLKSIKFKLPIIEEDMEMSLDDDRHVETQESKENETPRSKLRGISP